MSFPAEYGRRGPVGWRQWSATKWLIAVNIVVFFLDLLSRGRLSAVGAFSVSTAIRGLQVWRFITFQFLHAGVTHILVNMIVLYFFGPMVEGLLGKTRFTIFYLLCGLAGAGLFVVLEALGCLDVDQWSHLVGASAGIFGVMVGGACVYPRQRVQLLVFFILPISMQLRTLVLILLGLAVAVILGSGQNAGGEAAHLGGALMGWLLMMGWLKRGAKRTGHKFWQPGKDNFLRDEFRQ